MAVHMYRIKKRNRYRGPVLSLATFAVIVAVVVMLLNQTQARSGQEQVNLLKDALRRSAVTCYAVEGRYPPTLDYLVDNYGVVINEDRFIVSYDAYGENLMPSIRVLERGKELASYDDEYDD